VAYVDDHWGLCPECGGEPSFIHVGKTHFATCERDKTAWCVGYNLITTHTRLDDPDVIAIYGHADRDRIDAENLAELNANYRRVESVSSFEWRRSQRGIRTTPAGSLRIEADPEYVEKQADAVMDWLTARLG
jgi:hypothetical protein